MLGNFILSLFLPNFKFDPTKPISRRQRQIQYLTRFKKLPNPRKYNNFNIKKKITKYNFDNSFSYQIALFFNHTQTNIFHI